MGEQTVTAAEVLHDSKSELQELGVSAEQATEACRKIGEAWAQIAMTIEAMAPAFCRWIRKVAAEVEAQHEMETALRWASVDNRPLYNRYRHTKKKRIRKKYAKRILEWYRTEVAPVLRLKANKTSLYNLVATYKPLPGMRRVDFQKANGRPDYWLEWTTDDGHTKAFLSSSLGCPILTITTHDAAGGQLYHEAHRLSVEGLRERGMVEEATTAMERRRATHERVEPF